MLEFERSFDLPVIVYINSCNNTSEITAKLQNNEKLQYTTSKSIVYLTNFCSDTSMPADCTFYTEILVYFSIF